MGITSLLLLAPPSLSFPPPRSTSDSFPAPQPRRARNVPVFLQPQASPSDAGFGITVTPFVTLPRPRFSSLLSLPTLSPSRLRSLYIKRTYRCICLVLDPGRFSSPPVANPQPASEPATSPNPRTDAPSHPRLASHDTHSRPVHRYRGLACPYSHRPIFLPLTHVPAITARTFVDIRSRG